LFADSPNATAAGEVCTDSLVAESVHSGVYQAAVGSGAESVHSGVYSASKVKSWSPQVKLRNRERSSSRNLFPGGDRPTFFSCQDKLEVTLRRAVAEQNQQMIRETLPQIAGEECTDSPNATAAGEVCTDSLVAESVHSGVYQAAVGLGAVRLYAQRCEGILLHAKKIKTKGKIHPN
jgi:hypothetical protein